MSPTKLRRLAKNGTAAGTNGARTRSRGVSDASSEATPYGQELARLASVESRPQDAPMWPTHHIVWLQPALRPAIRGSSGLSIERHLRVPVGDFLNPGVTAVSRAHSLDTECNPLTPDLALVLPQSELQPRGWHPREHCRKEGNQ